VKIIEKNTTSSKQYYGISTNTSGLVDSSQNSPERLLSLAYPGKHPFKNPTSQPHENLSFKTLIA
jgi:hypothetical protein